MLKKPSKGKQKIALMLVLGLLILGVSSIMMHRKHPSLKKPTPAGNSQLQSKSTHFHWQHRPPQPIIIKKGDSLAKIFAQNSLSAAQLSNLMQTGKITAPLKNLQIGKKLTLFINSDKQLLRLEYPLSIDKSLVLTRGKENKFVAQIVSLPMQKKLTFAQLTIHGSLAKTAQQAHLSPQLTAQLESIFGWEVNLSRNLHNGDHFSLLYNEYLSKDKKIHDGHILIVQFKNKNKSYTAMRYKNPNGKTGYYLLNGKNTQGRFLRAPLKYRYVSSPFSLHRYHPILHIWRAHLGVDLAANRGTPIHAAADGKIAYIGWESGYGRTIVLHNGMHYSTLYAHMERFAKGLKRYQSVKRGQTIGYVGMSGLATGPHLHYEVRINGKHYNPMTVKLPGGLPIPKKDKSQFVKQSHSLLAELDTMQQTQVELADNATNKNHL